MLLGGWSSMTLCAGEMLAAWMVSRQLQILLFDTQLVQSLHMLELNIPLISHFD